ncbi:unnamed protein product [Urochloa humidicola]
MGTPASVAASLATGFSEGATNMERLAPRTIDHRVDVQHLLAEVRHLVDGVRDLIDGVRQLVDGVRHLVDGVQQERVRDEGHGGGVGHDREGLDIGHGGGGVGHACFPSCPSPRAASSSSPGVHACCPCCCKSRSKKNKLRSKKTNLAWEPTGHRGPRRPRAGAPPITAGLAGRARERRRGDLTGRAWEPRRPMRASPAARRNPNAASSPAALGSPAGRAGEPRRGGLTGYAREPCHGDLAGRPSPEMERERRRI